LDFLSASRKKNNINAHITLDSAQEMVGTILYLTSRAGGYTNGQEIVVDGGYIAVNPSVV
jgi:NAD(P)-dependent dehydrogenase (short-subunit alcohol dehydrogenase family)